jgi:protein-disulfide isomerase
MPFLRGSPVLLVGLIALGANTCKKNGGEDPKPPASATAEVSIPGVDTNSLTPRERREWAAQVSELLAPCPEVPVSIAQCVKEKRDCRACMPAAQFLLKQVQAGKPKKDREDAYLGRFDPKKVKTLATDGSPEKGAPDAVVTVVEWADFECPFCKIVYPLLDNLVERFEGHVKIVYKFYPLDSHPHGEIAARAAAAAQTQGKFWEMHHKLFDNQERLEQADLERYAKEIGLDVAKFRADMVSAEIRERIAKDKKQAEQVGLEGTPMIFVNGREIDLKSLVNVYDDLEAWVKLDIELAGKTPRPPPATPRTAAPVGPASADPRSAPSAAGSGSARPSASSGASAGAPPKGSK